MKRLFYFRHSTKDGFQNSIGEKGLALAEQVGAWMLNDVTAQEVDFNKVFHGPLIRTAQTALAFMSTFGGEFKTMPVVVEIGDDQLISDMVRPSQFRPLAGVMGYYAALLQCHGGESVDYWILRAVAAVINMFAAMDEDDDAVAFGHSPMIELALAGIMGTKKLPEEYLVFSDMEGVELQQDDAGNISIVGKISMTTSLPHAA